MKKSFVLAALLLVSAAVHAEETYLHNLPAADPDKVLGKSVGQIGAVSGFGTGFLVAPNKIISNRHVIGGIAKTHLPVWMTKYENDGPVHGYITEVVFAHEEYDMAVGVVHWTYPGFEVPDSLTLMRSSEFDSRVQSAGGKASIKTIGHSRSGPKIRQIGDYVKHNNWIMAHYPVHAPGGSGSPVFFENGNTVVGVATGIANWTESRLFHDQRHDYFGDLKTVIEAPLDPNAPKLLAGHASGAKSAAYSPNGQAIAVGSGDAVIRVWNANWSGVPKAPIHTLRAHTAAVLSVAYSPNGQTLVSGSLDSTVQVWNAGTGAKIRMLRHSSGVTSVAYSPNGQTIAAGGANSTIHIWNANTGAPIRTLQGHTASVLSVAYSPNGQMLASGSDDDTIRIWNAATGAHIRTLQGHTDDVNSVAYSPDGQTIVSGSDDDTIRIWNATTGAHIRTLQGHTNDVVSAAYSPNGSTIASGSLDSTARIWNAGTGALMQTLEWYKWWHTGAVWFAAYSPDSQTIAAGGADDTIRVWNFAARPIATVSGPSESQIGAFNVTITFSSAVTGFTSSDIVVTNGSASNFAGSGASYTATIQPSGVGVVTVSVPANAASNVWGSNEASNIYSADYRAQQVLTGHTDSVVSIAYSPDGQTIASGSEDSTVRIWNADTGAQIQTLQGHTDRVNSVAYSPDGQTIASGGFDETVRIWNANTGAEIRALEYPGWVFTVAYSPDGQTIVAGGGGSGVYVWSVSTGERLRILTGHTGVVYSAAYSPDGQTLATGSEDSTIRIWNANTGAHLRTLQGHTAPVNSVAYSPDGQTLVSGSFDYKVRLWNVNTGASIRTIEEHTNWVFSVAYSPDGQKIASGSGDNTVRTWNADTGAHITTFRGHTDLVRSVAYSPDGQKFASGGDDNTVRLWKITDLAAPVTSLTTTVFGPRFTQTGSFKVTIVFSAEATGFTLDDIAVTNGSASNFAGSGKSYTATITPSGAGAVTVSVPAAAANAPALGSSEASNTYSVVYREQQTLKGHTAEVLSVAYSPDGQTIASGSGDNTIRLWDINTGEQRGQPLTGHGDAVRSVTYSPDGQTIATGSDDRTVRLWDADTGAHIRTLQGDTNWIFSVAYSPDGQKLAACSEYGTVRTWIVKTWEPQDYHTYPNKIFSVAYSPDGQTIASGSTRWVWLWNANAHKSLSGHSHAVYSVAYSPDGQTIASGSLDRTIRLWNAETGAQRGQPLTGHTNYVLSVAYSPDGRTIASGSADKTIGIWSAETGERLRTLEGHEDYVWSVTYSPDGQTIASGSRDKTVRTWGVGDLAVPTTRLTTTVLGPSVTQTGAFFLRVLFSSDVTGFTSSDIVVTNGSVTSFAGSGKSYTATIEPSNDGAVTVNIPANAVDSDLGKNEASEPYSVDYRRQQILSGHQGTVYSVAYSPDGRTIATGSGDTTIRIWDVNTEAHLRTIQIRTPTGLRVGVRSIAYSPDSQTIVAGAADGSVHLWNVKTGERIRSLIGHSNSVLTVAYSPDGRTIAGGGFDDTIQIWDADTGAHLKTIEYLNWVYTVAYSPDGQSFASGGVDAMVRMWDANTRNPIRTLRGHTLGVFSAAYSPDSQKIAAAGGDSTVRIWNANTGAYLRTLEGHKDWARSVAYSPDGQTIASGSFDTTVRVWNANTGAGMRTLKGHTGRVFSVAYSPDGQTIVSGGDDNMVRIWGVSDLAPPPATTVSGPSEAPASAFNVKIEFSAAVTGFTLDDIIVTNGSATNLAGSGKSYTATIEPASGDAVDAVTVRVPANAASNAAGSNEASNTYSVNIVRGTSFTINMRQGLNMLHVPVKDPEIEKLSDLYAALGGSQDVQFLLAYSPASNRFVSYADGLAGSSSDLPLYDETAVLASMKNAKPVTFTGGLLKQEVPLRAGMNMIGVTRAGAVETIGDLAGLTTVPLNVIALKVDDSGNALFQLATDSTDAAKGGDGYFILAEAETVLTFDGSAWSNEASTAAASAEAVAYDPSATPLLVAEGSVAREDNLAPLNGLEISIANLQNGQTASDIAGRGSASGRFSLPLLALTGDSYAIGDAFDLRVSDSSGTFGGVQTMRVVLDKESVSTGRIDIGKLLATAIPAESALLPNYPNPFNPETWIPFDLTEASRVKITIYNAAGQTVRVLQLGELPAGTYRSRGKAAHWDGRNALGEPVASGVYYVRIEAGSFTALRRMVVLK